MFCLLQTATMEGLLGKKAIIFDFCVLFMGIVLAITITLCCIFQVLLHMITVHQLHQNRKGYSLSSYIVIFAVFFGKM